jgi:ribonuclease I
MIFTRFFYMKIKTITSSKIATILYYALAQKIMPSCNLRQREWQQNLGACKGNTLKLQIVILS